MKNYKKEVLNLINRVVSYKRIAGNTIILYFDGKPGEDNTKSIWIDPAWRYEFRKKYIIGSEDFPWEKEKGQTLDEFNRIFENQCKKTDKLIGSTVIDLKIDDVSNDIVLFFENHQIIRKVQSSLNFEGWVYRDHSRNLKIMAFVDHLEGVTENDR